MRDLEVLHRSAETRGSGQPPLLFVHGGYMGAWCWAEHFLPEFAARGFACHAVSLRGHGASAGAETLDDAGIDDYVDDVGQALSMLERPPWVVGHSMGAVVAQHVARRFEVAGVVLLAPVPPLGLLASSFEIGMRAPELYGQFALVQGGHGHLADIARLRGALFADDMPLGRAAEYFKRLGRESQRALAQLAWPQICSVHLPSSLPVAVVGGNEDGLFPAANLRATAAWIGVDARILPGLGHALMLDRRWKSAVDCIEACVRTAKAGMPGR